jgi:hypothetical protein
MNRSSGFATPLLALVLDKEYGLDGELDRRIREAVVNLPTSFGQCRRTVMNGTQACTAVTTTGPLSAHANLLIGRSMLKVP